MTFKHKDGQRVPVLLTSHVRYDPQGQILGYEGIIVDQSQRKQIEEDYRRLFENVGCGVFISSKRGKFLNVNKTLLDMLGYESKEEFLKIDITKDLYLRPQDRKKFREMIEQDGRVIDYEVDFKRKDGSVIPILLTGPCRASAALLNSYSSRRSLSCRPKLCARNLLRNLPNIVVFQS